MIITSLEVSEPSSKPPVGLLLSKLVSNYLGILGSKLQAKLEV